MSDFENCLHSKIKFRFILFRENDILYIFCAFLKALFRIENVIKSQILNWKKHNAPDLLKNFHNASEFDWKVFTTRQISNKKFYNLLDFNLTFFSSF